MKKAIAIIGAFSLPMLALAQTIQSVLVVFKNIIDIATVVVVALALLWFLWGLAQYILNGPGEKQEDGRNRMIWGIVALFVMVSVWGLVRVLSNTLGTGTGGSAPIPGVGGVGVSGSSGTVGVSVSGQSGGFWGSFPNPF